MMGELGLDRLKISNAINDEVYATVTADSLSAIARDVLTNFEGDPSLERRFSGGDGFFSQFSVAELRRELGDWKRELKESAGTAAREAEKKIAEINKEIVSRGGDSLSAIARDALDGEQSREELRETIRKLRENGADKGVISRLQRKLDELERGGNRDSLADLVDRVRSGIREQVGDSSLTITGAQLKTLKNLLKLV